MAFLSLSERQISTSAVQQLSLYLPDCRVTTSPRKSSGQLETPDTWDLPSNVTGMDPQLFNGFLCPALADTRLVGVHVYNPLGSNWENQPV